MIRPFIWPKKWASASSRFVGAMVSLTLFCGVFCDGMNARADSSKYRMGGGDHDVPTPFEVSTKFELASGEIYLLYGSIIFAGQNGRDDTEVRGETTGNTARKPYFAIDLNRHSWLANVKRSGSPYYPLEGKRTDWLPLENQYVRLLCRAHGRIISENGKMKYVISLDPVLRD